MKMNKKVLSMFVVGVLALGLGAALLVPYLSNTITGTVDVESPFTFEISTDGSASSYSDSVIIDETMFGGETETVFTKLTNNADVKISNRTVNFVITNEIGNNFEGTEFNVEAFTFDGTPAGDVNCVADGKELVCTTGVVTLDAGATQKIKFEVTADVAIKPDTYTFSAEVLA